MKRLVLSEHIQVDLFGCHRWQGTLSLDGYARAGKDLAHRRGWEEANGPIPEHVQVHHTCGVRDCINIDHLRLIDRSEHARLDHSFTGRIARNRPPRLAA